MDQNRKNGMEFVTGLNERIIFLKVKVWRGFLLAGDNRMWDGLTRFPSVGRLEDRMKKAYNPFNGYRLYPRIRVIESVQSGYFEVALFIDCRDLSPIFFFE